MKAIEINLSNITQHNFPITKKESLLKGEK